MIDWIIKNREWLFSVVGVAILLGVATFIRRRLSTKSTPTESSAVSMVMVVPNHNHQPKDSFEVEGYSKKPSPKEIWAAIQATPPFQQPAKSSSYVGLKVQWVTTFQSCTNQGVGKVKIHMTDPKSIQWVYLEDLEIEKYPQFKIAHTGARIQFAGTITRVEISGIFVVPEKIQFPDSA